MFVLYKNYPLILYGVMLVFQKKKKSEGDQLLLITVHITYLNINYNRFMFSVY